MGSCLAVRSEIPPPPAVLLAATLSVSSPFLQALGAAGPTVIINEFLNTPEDPTRLLSDAFVLLVNARDVRPRDLQESGAIRKVLAYHVPMVLENHGREHIKALSGLGIEPQTRVVVIHSKPGHRIHTITAIDQPQGPPSTEFVLEAVNRALRNRGRLTGTSNEPPVPERQAYALRVFALGHGSA